MQWIDRCSPGRRLRMAAAILLATASPAVAQPPENAALLQAVAAYEGGELSRAVALLESLPASLPSRDRAIRVLYRGLIHFAEGELPQARVAFAQAVGIDPAIRLNPQVHSPSSVRAFEAARDSVVAVWRSEARRTGANGDWDTALQHWENVLAAFPADDEAGVQARILRNRLNVEPPGTPTPPPPPATDPDSAVLADLDLYSPGGAMMMGMVMPGLGEFYTGRTGRGMLYLLAAGGAAAAGVLYTNTAVQCLSVPVDGTCPPADIAGETTERPYLAHGIGAAAAITFIGAIDAMIGAQRKNAQARDAAARSRGSGPSLTGPALQASARSVQISWLGIRF